MRWLLYGSMTTAVREALVRRGDQAQDLAALGFTADAPLKDVLKAAQKNQLDILTTDGTLVNGVYELDLWFQRSIVYLQLEGGDVEQDDAIDRLFARHKRLTPGRLYTVTGTRVKVRQLPGKR